MVSWLIGWLVVLCCLCSLLCVLCCMCLRLCVLWCAVLFRVYVCMSVRVWVSPSLVWLLADIA